MESVRWGSAVVTVDRLLRAPAGVITEVAPRRVVVFVGGIDVFVVGGAGVEGVYVQQLPGAVGGVEVGPVAAVVVPDEVIAVDDQAGGFVDAGGEGELAAGAVG